MFHHQGAKIYNVTFSFTSIYFLCVMSIYIYIYIYHIYISALLVFVWTYAFNSTLSSFNKSPVFSKIIMHFTYQQTTTKTMYIQSVIMRLINWSRWVFKHTRNHHYDAVKFVHIDNIFCMQTYLVRVRVSDQLEVPSGPMVEKY